MTEQKNFIAKEERQKGKISFGLYVQYLKSMRGLFLVSPVILILLTATSFTDNVFRFFVALWVDNRGFMHDLKSSEVIFVFFLFCLVTILVRALSWIVLMGFLSNGARLLHNQMVESFSNVRVTFFDENPTGRLIRRFSGDYSQLADEIPNVFSDILACIFELIVVLFIVTFQVPIAIVAVLPCGYFYFHVQKIFKPAMREVQRYSKVLETPVWSLFTETITGYQTIRAFGKTSNFYSRLLRLSKEYAKVVLVQSRFLRWLNVRLKIISEFFSLCVTLVVVYFAVYGELGVGKAGFLMSLTLGLESMMQWFTRSISMIDSKMVSVERILEYKSLAPEKLTRSLVNTHFTSLPAVDLSNKWPDKGEIIFENVVTSYRPDLPIILNDLSLKFEAGKRTGIIGRTGAGKSSIFQTLFQMTYLHSGRILVDGVDIASLPIEKARSIFAIVPQEPHLFSGSVKYNLDRTGQYSEQQMWQALREVQLAEYIEMLPGKLDYQLVERGNNFSVGQRQLLCMARAILKNPKIILMDEATASVDLGTESLIQETMDKVFANKTLIIIAHRLDTLKNADFVVRLRNGKLIDYGTSKEVISKLSGRIEEDLV